VHLGHEALEAFNGVDTTPDDAPIQRIRITKWAAARRPAAPSLPPALCMLPCPPPRSSRPACAFGAAVCLASTRPAAVPASPPSPCYRCGATNAKGVHDSLDEAAKETAEQAAARLEQESRDTKASIL
jgi:hypothetical protein